MTGIEGKVIAITGASSGIGEATAMHLAERGAKIIMGARRADRLTRLAEAISLKGGDATALAIDVKRHEDIHRFVDLAIEKYEKLDVLISNAGIAPISPLDELKVEDWEAMIDVNIRGVLFGIANALPVFRRQGFGHFINILSTAGMTIAPTMAVYAGTKNAVRAISEGLRQEAGASLRVTTVSPGYVQTELASSMTDPALRERTKAGMKSMGISPDAVAKAIAFAIEQPNDVDIGEIVIRPTAQA